MQRFSSDNGLAQLLAYIKTLLGGKVDIQNGKGLSTNDFTNELKWKLDGVEEGAQANQNAFGTVLVGDDEIIAEAESDILTLTAGDNIAFEPVVEEKRLTISATDTTYTEATQDESGLLSAEDKVKLDTLNQWLGEEITALTNEELEALMK